MSYYYSREVDSSFERAVEAVIESLKAEGFGVLSDIDVAQTLGQKLGVEMPAYRILGACNPAMAYRALQVEDKIGTMLPCNVIVQRRNDDVVEVSAVDPVESMRAIDNPALLHLAQQVRQRLWSAINAIQVREEA